MFARLITPVLHRLPLLTQPSKTYYALKMMQKARIVDMSQQHNIVMEKNIMMKANHPYVRRPAADAQTLSVWVWVVVVVVVAGVEGWSQPLRRRCTVLLRLCSVPRPVFLCRS